ncbi:MAG: PQQ-dependent sugar dehydrogenase [Verrucomicrobia bacterium]|nr:PQQ-dependent sugar dehydrogenase [Verrucomicrobiota bacterium]
MAPSQFGRTRRFLILVLTAAVVVVAAVVFKAGPPDRPYGMTQRPAAEAYLGFPTAPVFSSETRWASEAAFPNVTFKNPVVMEPEPGTDRIFIGELEGTVAAISSRDPMTSVRTTILDLTGQTQGGFDSGLLGMAFHPDYGRDGSPNRDHVYLFYSWSDRPVMVGRPEHTTVTWTRVSRFTMDRETGMLMKGSELVLIHQKKRIIFHVGGGMFFHPQDGFLYISVGDEGGQQDSLQNSQRIDRNLFSGVLRIDVDRKGGSISHPIPKQPADGETAHYYIPNHNPFVGVPGALEEFYAIGLRSPHRMTYDKADNLAWIGEVGQAAREEIEVLQFDKAPQNFQWAVKEGNRPGFKEMPGQPLGIWTNSVWEYGRDEGRSVTGGYVYRGQRHPALAGKYICSDFANGKVWALSYATTGDQVRVTNVELLAGGEGFRNYHGGVGGITSFGLDHNQELYILRHGRNTRIEHLVKAEPRKGNVPTRLSETGAFIDLASLQPTSALIPYDVNVPQWVNGALVRRWLSVPSGKTIRFDRDERWRFPPGTVFVEHFDWARKPAEPDQSRRLETRFLIGKEDGSFYGVTYRWRPDKSDADLVTNDDENASLECLGEKGERVRVLWVFPSPKNCLQCHTDGAGYVLGVKTRQTNRDFAHPSGVTDNQLRSWSHAGLFSEKLNPTALTRYPQLAPLDNVAAGLESRVRSYLDANCAHCHGAAPIPSAWIGNYNVPLNHQLLIFGPLAGLRKSDEHHVISPKDPVGSELHQRVSENIIGKRMPPLGSDRVDTQFVTVLEEWIEHLPRVEAKPPAIESAIIRNGNTLAVTFSEAVQPGSASGGAEEPGNYEISGGVSVRSALLAPDRRTVLLSTSPLQSGADHTVRVSRVSDRAEKPNPIPPATEARATRASSR